MFEYTVSAANYTRLDSVMGVLNVESYNYSTLPSQVPISKMEHESIAETNSLLSTEISGSWRTSVIRVAVVKTEIILGDLFLLSLPSCRQRMLYHVRDSLQTLSPLWAPHL